MAYPELAGPYGFKPTNLIGGQYSTGAFRQIPIASGNTTSIFNGDIVDIDSNGLLIKSTATVGTTAASGVGVFIGCAYTDPNLKYFIQKQYYPAGTAATDIVGYVIDDPNQLFKAAVTADTTTTLGYVLRSAVGENATIVQNVGTSATDTGNSANSILQTTSASTATFPMRIIDVVPETSYQFLNATPAYETRYREVIIKWNQDAHRYQNSTGI